MFYIVEVDNQLDEFINKGYDRVFIEPIYFNNNTHPVLNNISLLYIKPLNGDKGYMVCLKHSETFSLNKTRVNTLLNSFKEIYLRDRKSFLHHFPLSNTVNIFKEIEEQNTHAHQFLLNKHPFPNILIPLVKHYEKCELIFNNIKEYCVLSSDKKFKNKLINVFFAIERSGIQINKELFNRFFELNEEYSIKNNEIYTQYNLNTTTGRPSNSFNNINFAALNKENGCREAFIPKNDCFIEIDIRAYHPTLIAKLINFDFGEETPYQYFAREANIKLEDAKILMFKQLYGGIYTKYQNIEFFKKTKEYIDNLWKEFNENGFIECPISQHKFINNLEDINPQKLFNYLLQNLETSNNVLILWDIIKLIKHQSTKIVLYTYDSILIDYKEKDNVLEAIQNIFTTKYKLKIKTTKGANYNKMFSI